MGLADFVVRNYSTMVKVVLPASFSYGLLYTLTQGSSPLDDARQAVLGGEGGMQTAPLTYRVRLGSAGERAM